MQKGTCTFGDKCTYRHECSEVKEEARKTVVCTYFLKGSCRHKERCWFSHQVDKPENSQDAIKRNESAQEEKDDAETPILAHPSAFCAKPAEPVVSLLSTLSINDEETSSVASLEMEDETTKCGICLESIAGRGERFALLSNCIHPFCYQCAQSWHRNPSYRKSRKVKNTADVHSLVKHSCPICRTDSEYMFPSKNYLIGAEKDAYIAQYKAERLNRKCKFFDGNIGSCPFGQECFYAHLDEAGTDLKPCDQKKGSKKSKLELEDGIEYSDNADGEETEEPFSWGVFGYTPPEHTHHSVFGNNDARNIFSAPSPYPSFLSNDEQPTSDQNVPSLGSLLSAYHANTDNDEDIGGTSTWAPQLNIFSSDANDSSSQNIFSSDTNNSSSQNIFSSDANDSSSQNMLSSYTNNSSSQNIFSSDANDSSSQNIFSSDVNTNNSNSQSPWCNTDDANDNDAGSFSFDNQNAMEEQLRRL